MYFYCSVMYEVYIIFAPLCDDYNTIYYHLAGHIFDIPQPINITGYYTHNPNIYIPCIYIDHIHIPVCVLLESIGRFRCMRLMTDGKLNVTISVVK